MIWRDVFMAMYIMKGLCVIGIILNLSLIHIYFDGVALLDL